MVIKCLVSQGANLVTFNKNNRWVNAGPISEITSELILSTGFEYEQLDTSLDSIFLDYSVYDTLDDGREVYCSDTITKSMNIISLEEYTTVDDVEKLKASVPSFLPKDSLAEGYCIYAYSEDTDFNPIIREVSFSRTSTHNSGIDLQINSIYNLDSKIKYRIKINNVYEEWSDEYDAFNIAEAHIEFGKLNFGLNTITVEVCDASNTSKSNTLVLADALEVTNDAPEIVIIRSDSNSYKVHFNISDPDNDRISYRLLMDNDKYKQEVIKDWSEFKQSPLNEIYYIDSNKVVIDDYNLITILAKDEYSDTIIGKTTYSFIGKYKNIVFTDETGDYLTTDKGSILKVLDLEKIIAGTTSEIKEVTLKNNNNESITNLSLSVDYINKVDGASVKISKTKNPFNGSESISYGAENIQSTDTKKIYVKLESERYSEGLCTFNVVADADIVPMQN